MARAAILAGMIALWSADASARAVVDAFAPEALAVTIYRDPDRGVGQAMARERPRGFAMITETRQVTLPPGESTIRFTGVAEGMVAVSAIVTGLPGGTIEKNRNADLLSPAALVDGTLGNRVTITRTDPASGAERSEDAVIRTRADGGLVLETAAGFEAVRCSGLPERLSFDRVPAGLSAQPVYSIDTRDDAGGSYRVELTYLAWGFDWQAHYVARVADRDRGEGLTLDLLSWLTVLNDNGQSFPDAELLVVAGRLNVESDFRQLADPPTARPLRLTCYPLGSTAAGSPEQKFGAPPPPPPLGISAPPMAESITVTGARMADSMMRAPAMMAQEEQLGDLKLYRVPEPVTVSAKGLKQVAFLHREGVQGRLVYEAPCAPLRGGAGAESARLRFETVNDARHGLAAALPMGGITFFEPSSAGDLLLAEEQLRDHAEGQDVEIALGESAQVQLTCASTGDAERAAAGDWSPMRGVLANANPDPVSVRLLLGRSDQWRVRGLRGTRVKDGVIVWEGQVPANGRRQVEWDVRPATAVD